MMAEHVLPLCGTSAALSDGLRLVWLQAGGRATSRQELSHALNEAIAAVPARGSDAQKAAANATVSVLESALLAPLQGVAIARAAQATRAAVESALAAVPVADAKALAEELTWLNWALDIAADVPRPTRATFHRPEAPVGGWTARISSADLPLFGSV